MLVGAGLTACYTFRMVWLVFFGEARSHLHGHDATPFMRVSLSLLAIGTLTSWLLAGPFFHLLEATMPFHKLHALSLGGMAHEIFGAPLTWGALAVIGLGLLAWWGRASLAGLTASLEWFAALAQKSFGFEWINQQVVCLTQSLAGGFRTTQVGHLSWNVVGIVGGLVAVLILLTWGN
jgi:NADH-quinone oxidoreductase subunit L